MVEGRGGGGGGGGGSQPVHSHENYSYISLLSVVSLGICIDMA